MQHPITDNTTTTPAAPSAPAAWPDYAAVKAAFANRAAAPKVNINRPAKRPPRPRRVSFGGSDE
jgi:hypothetical protein